MSGSEVLGFAARVLEREQALVEPAGSGAIEAILPERLQRALELEELVLLSDGETDESGEPCGYGTETLGRLARLAIGEGRAGAFRADLDPCPPREPSGVCGLNVSLRVRRSWSAAGWTLVGFARYQASCDDERLGLVHAAVAAPEGVPVPVPSLADLPLAPLAPARLAAAPLEPAVPHLMASLRRAAAEDVRPFREAVARRRARDAERLRRYFDEVERDIRRRLRGRGGAPLRAKLASLPGELERRLAEVEAGCVLRVRVDIVALAAVLGPGGWTELEVRRRKRMRALRVRYDGIARRWLGLRCDGCGAASLAFAMCDEAAHVLCPACWDACGSGGRRPCFRCEGKPGREPWAEALRVGDLRPSGPRHAAGRDGEAGERETPSPARARAGAAVGRRASASAGDEEPTAGKGRRRGPTARKRRRRRRPRGDGAEEALRGQVLELLKAYRVPLSSQQIRCVVEVDAEDLRRLLGPLIEQGLVGRVGQRRGMRYYWTGPGGSEERPT